MRGAAQEHANRFMALPRHILTGFHPDPEGRKWFRPRNPVVYRVPQKLIPGPPPLHYGPDGRHTAPALLDPKCNGKPHYKWKSYYRAEGALTPDWPL